MIGRYGNLNIYRELLNSSDFMRFLAGTALIPVYFAVKMAGLPGIPGTEIKTADLLLIASALINGVPIIIGAVKGLLEKQINVDELVSIAIIACVATGEFFEAATVASIMVLGSLLENSVSAKARSSIQDLTELVSNEARIIVDGIEMPEDISKITKGSILVTRPGEIIALDAVLTEGSTSVDESSVTGEAIPVLKKPGDKLISGTLNLDGYVKSHVESIWEDSTFNKIIKMITAAENSKVSAARLVDRYAAWFTPLILLTAAAVLIIRKDFQSAVTVIIVGCPCSFLLSGPIPAVAAVSRAAREGIMIKSGAALERIATADAVFFDKTGTLTEGRPAVRKIIPVNGYTETDVLKYASSVEIGSEHPLARAVLNAAAERNLKFTAADSIKALPGKGLKGILEGSEIFIGTDAAAQKSGFTCSTVLVNGSMAGTIEFTDSMRKNAVKLAAGIRKTGIKDVRILSGDSEKPVAETASNAGIDTFHHSLTPENKYSLVRNYSGNPLFAGDGLNDAPALAAAHVGIAMGGSGTGAVLETAEIVLLNDRIELIPFIIMLGKRMTSVIKVNILLSLGINTAAVAAAFSGHLTPVWGAVIHNIGSIAVVSLSASVGFMRQGR